MMSENNKLDVEFGQIESVKLPSVWQSFKKDIKEKTFFSLVLPVLSILVIFLGLILNNSIVFLFGIITPLFIYTVLWVSLTNEFIKEFSLKIGFDYKPFGEITSVDGTLFKIGGAQTISEQACGLYYNHETRFFVFTTVEGTGKYKSLHSFSVLEIKFDMELPDIILNNKENFFGSNPLLFVNEKRIETEGDFSKRFSLYAPVEYEIEVLQIFSPETMQMFMNKTKDFNMEIYKDKVYIYHNSRINNKDDIVSIYDLAKDIIQNLNTTFESMKGGVEAMSKYYKLT